MDLIDFKAKAKDELFQILDYWELNSIDLENNGFFGFINNESKIDSKADKGLILNARILWTFAAAYPFTSNIKHYELATRAYDYLIKKFYDHTNEGLYWKVDFKGKPIEKKKQVYGQAFGIYGLVEYYKISKETKALYYAIQLFNAIEKYSFDEKMGGYFEALSEDWKPIEDLRLSDKDANEKKTMNTHLHILEAYTSLYLVWKNEDLLRQIKRLIEVFFKHIIDPDHFYQHLFLDENWKVKSTIISYGHDIETSWLLWKAAKATEDSEIIQKTKHLAIKLGEKSLDGLDVNHGINYEYDFEKKHLDTDKHWWVQAEAVVGFFNLYELSHNPKYLEHSISTWKFIEQYIKDPINGEWFWGRKANGELMRDEKVSFWKCPYHNARACMEISKRIDKIITENNEVSQKELV